jgi:hypothetical protein
VSAELLDDLARALASTDVEVQLCLRAIAITMEARELTAEVREARLLVFWRELFHLAVGRSITDAEARQLSRCIHPPLLQ